MNSIQKNLQELEKRKKKDIANSINRKQERVYLSNLYGKGYNESLDEFLKLVNELKQLKLKDRDCNKLGKLGELATFVYYVIYKHYACLFSPTDAEEYFIQECYGDYFIHDYENEITFTVDSKSSTVWDYIPRLNVSLAHFDKNNNPYYGKIVKKKTNFSWLYYLDKCDKINAFNLDLMQLLIIEDFQSIRDILLTKYITVKGNLIDDNIDDLNSKFRYEALIKRPSMFDNKGTDREVKTEVLSLALTDEVINYLGSELTVIQFKEKRDDCFPF